MINATPKQLRTAANIQEKIQELQGELNSILGGADETPAIKTPPKRKKFSAYTRAKMRRAQMARWAMIKGTVPSAKSARKAKNKISAQGLANIRAAQLARWAKMKGRAPKRKFTAVGRARLAELAKARWAKVKAEGKSRL